MLVEAEETDKMKRAWRDIGLYVHVPFCSAICHYCDFAKTANFDSSTVEKYFTHLHQQLVVWLSSLPPGTKFKSIFFGGGTPGLFAREYAPLFTLLAPFMEATTEVSLEANPNDVTSAQIASWRALGFNRLSLGVQTFAAAGLKFLTRDHDATQARQAVELALLDFPSVNLDLIYGWQGQTAESWRQDLSIALQMGVPHLSLYTLTYEPRTVIGRRQTRGVVTAAADENLADSYEVACAQLAATGYVHDEVSNWARPGHTCEHNWLYWRDGHFIGVGAGAHGYVPGADGLGVRYAYPRSVQGFLATTLAASGGAADVLAQTSSLELQDRSIDAWIAEYVGSSLRTRMGTDLMHIRECTRRILQPNAVLREGIQRGLVLFDGATLRLTPGEWFRETAWSVELIRSLVD